jgi:hypothetical protein
MDFEPDIRILKKIRIGQLEPGLAREIVELAQSMGHETTITSKTRLDFLLRIYQAEKVREKRSKGALRKAEDLIMRLSSLHFEVMHKERSRRKEERKKGIANVPSEVEVPVSKKLTELFSSIGIEDEKTIQKAVALFGEKECIERIELLGMCFLGEEIVKKVFGEHPETFLIASRGDFSSEIEAMESKKSFLDIARDAKGLPAWADYEHTPGILLDSYEDIVRLLKLQLPEEPPQSTKKEEVKYRGKPMDPDDFIRVVSGLGFSPIRETKHGTLMKNAAGGIMCVQKGHRKQEELNPSTIKKKLTEAGVDLDDFERKRRELSL